MRHSISPLELLALFAAVFILHSVAITFHLYWNFWWFDIGMHFFGGAVIGIFVLWFVEPKSKRSALLLVIIAPLCAGLLWEIYEVVSGNILVDTRFYFRDTVLDLLTNVFGGLSSYAYFTTYK